MRHIEYYFIGSIITMLLGAYRAWNGKVSVESDPLTSFAAFILWPIFLSVLIYSTFKNKRN